MRVFCNLPNCGNEVSGKRFSPAQGGMVSEDLSEDDAQHFASIPGYSIFDGPVPAGQANPEPQGEGEASGEEEPPAPATPEPQGEGRSGSRKGHRAR